MKALETRKKIVEPLSISFISRSRLKTTIDLSVPSLARLLEVAVKKV